MLILKYYNELIKIAEEFLRYISGPHINRTCFKKFDFCTNFLYDSLFAYTIEQLLNKNFPRIPEGLKYKREGFSSFLYFFLLIISNSFFD